MFQIVFGQSNLPLILIRITIYHFTDLKIKYKYKYQITYFIYTLYSKL